MSTENGHGRHPDTTEGEINLSVHRSEWQSAHLDDEIRSLLEKDAQYFLHQSLSTPCLTALERSEGSRIYDLAGKGYLDFHGNSAHQVGYGHPRVIEAVTKELQSLPFSPRRFANRAAVDLAAKLAELSPGKLKKMLFAPGGTSANGIALKLARLATGRFKVLSFWDAFHGASLDAISIGGEALFRRNMGPLLPGCIQVPAPDSDCFGAGKLSWEEAANYIDYVMDHEGDVAAFIAEPMRCTTINIPPAAFWRKVRDICDRQGALLIFDEIPICLGRTGYMFACEHYGVVPDMLCIGKGLGGGIFPMAATLVRDDLDIAGDQALGHYTHEKSPVGCAAALATIRVIEEDDLLERSRELGASVMERLEHLTRAHRIVTEARGVGLMMGLELAAPPGSDIDAADVAERVLYEALSRGLSFKISGSKVLTLTPPLTISEDDMDEALAILTASISAVEARLGINCSPGNSRKDAPWT